MCYVDKSFNEVVLSYVDNIIYQHVESVFIVCNTSICQRNGNCFTLHYLYTNNIRLELSLHNNEFLPPYLACNLTHSIHKK